MAEYIDKSALVAEIERRIEKCDIFCIVADNNNAKDAMEEIKREIQHYKSLLDFLDILEVKEVDINKEISQFIDTNFEKATIGHKLSLRRTAKHFFELGLKAKGE